MSALVSEFKVNVHADPIDGYSMKDYDFECHFHVYSNRVVVVKKKDMRMVDKDNYIAILDAEKVKTLGRGAVTMTFVGYVPDADFPDGYRTEVAEVCDKITVI